MRIDPEDLRRHYHTLSDEELVAIDRAELTEMAAAIYDQEIAKRDLSSQEPAEGGDEEEERGELHSWPDQVLVPEDELDIDNGPPPDWLDDAACACAFTMSDTVAYVSEAVQARAALRAAGIPCYISLNEVESPTAGQVSRHEYCVMVPGALNLHAVSVLDRDLFNAKHEDDWRVHLQALSDSELGALSPEVFSAGLLDRVARLTRTYQEEIVRRGLKPRR